MSALFKRLFLATLLAAAPAIASAQSDDAPQDDAVVETSAEDEEDAETDAPADETAEGDEDETEELSEADAWAEKLRQRHHEGDVALGVCGGRMSALMWFYQSSVADGRDDLQPAYDALRESRTILKQEAERRAVEDGIGTSVSVMNEHGAEQWKALVEASEEPDEFQKVHDELFAGVQECLSLFFNRGAVRSDAEAVAEPAVETDAEDADGADD